MKTELVVTKKLKQLQRDIHKVPVGMDEEVSKIRCEIDALLWVLDRNRWREV